MISQYDFETAKAHLLQNGSSNLLLLEERVTSVLSNYLFNEYPIIKQDFDSAWLTFPFWEVYAPIQRGHMPRGEAYPWGEVGEKVLEGHLYSSLKSLFTNVRFPGIPYGHDIRFLTDEAFIHIDVKSTGPTDNPDEVVSSPNQVTGNGLFTPAGIINSEVDMAGTRVTRSFRPELPPFYLVNNRIIPVLTFYVKVVYSVSALGNQPLEYIELVCVPNGLPFFESPNYNYQFPGILTPGKDEQHVVRKRTRIKLNHLARINNWRCQKFLLDPLTQQATVKYRF